MKWNVRMINLQSICKIHNLRYVRKYSHSCFMLCDMMWPPRIQAKCFIWVYLSGERWSKIYILTWLRRWWSYMTMCIGIIIKYHVRYCIHNEIKYTYSSTYVQLRNSSCKAEICSAILTMPFIGLHNMRQAVQSRYTRWNVVRCCPWSHHYKCQYQNWNENKPRHQGYYYSGAFIYRSPIFKKSLQKLEYMTMCQDSNSSSVCWAPYPIMKALCESILLRCNSDITTGQNTTRDLAH